MLRPESIAPARAERSSAATSRLSVPIVTSSPSGWTKFGPLLRVYAWCA
jgi:hypothetical protein